MNEVLISLGSNLGNRQKNLGECIKLLSRRLILIKKSSVFETNPYGVEDHPTYLNQAVLFQSDLIPTSLLNLAKKVERKLGRYNKGNLSPRVIDIDIVLINSKKINRRNFRVPHKDYRNRLFVIIPTEEINRYFRLINFRLLGLKTARKRQNKISNAVRPYSQEVQLKRKS